MFCALKKGVAASCYVVADAFLNACCSLGNKVTSKQMHNFFKMTEMSFVIRIRQKNSK
jgi:7,8-dihydro-6-hydroxymethylpterin-pyrophosphokinase